MQTARPVMPTLSIVSGTGLPSSTKETPAYSSMIYLNVEDYEGRTRLPLPATYLNNMWSPQQTNVDNL